MLTVHIGTPNELPYHFKGNVTKYIFGEQVKQLLLSYTDFRAATLLKRESSTVFKS